MEATRVFASAPWSGLPKVGNTQHPLVTCSRCGVRRSTKAGRNTKVCRDCHEFLLMSGETW